jgi:hypothetical protein
MHPNLTSFKKPKIQFSQYQDALEDAQTPNKPVSKQPTFIMANLQNYPTSKCSVLMHVTISVMPAGALVGYALQNCSAIRL